MSTRPQYSRPYEMGTRAAASADFTSSNLYLKQDAPHYAIQVNVSGQAGGFAATAQREASVDGVNFLPYSSAVNISAGGTIFAETSGIPYMRVKIDITAGSANISIYGYCIG